MNRGKYDRVVGQIFDLKPAKAGDKIACPTLCDLFFLLCAICAPALAATPEPDLVPVISRQASRVTELPGEFQPFLSVSLHAKVPGYVDRILVDRSSVAEAESWLEAAESERLQAEAQLAAVESTYTRLKDAAETPGAIAGNELIQVEKQVEAARAMVRSRQQASRAAEAAVQAQKELNPTCGSPLPLMASSRTAWCIPGRWWVRAPIQ